MFRHGGTLDKYLGDGLMATFGTPFAGDSDALNALRCAKGMIGSIAELNRNAAAATSRRSRSASDCTTVKSCWGISASTGSNSP